MRKDEYVFDVYVSTFGIGSYGGLDDRVKRRRKKHPLGFAPPKPPAKPKPRKLT